MVSSVLTLKSLTQLYRYSLSAQLLCVLLPVNRGVFSMCVKFMDTRLLGCFTGRCVLVSDSEVAAVKTQKLLERKEEITPGLEISTG